MRRPTAAAFNLTQSLRGLLGPPGVNVHAVLTGPTDTDMTRCIARVADRTTVRFSDVGLTPEVTC